MISRIHFPVEIFYGASEHSLHRDFDHLEMVITANIANFQKVTRNID